jgi:hypothetical protein
MQVGACPYHLQGRKLAAAGNLEVEVEDEVKEVEDEVKEVGDEVKGEAACV